MLKFTKYKDDRACFVYPAHYQFEATPAGYYFQESKSKAMMMFVAPRELALNVFEGKAEGPPPDALRTKVVHHEYVLGGKHGRAIDWASFRPNGTLFGNTLEFYMTTENWYAQIELYTRPPANRNELERIVSSLEL